MSIFFKKPLQRTLSLFLVASFFSVTIATASDVSADAVTSEEVHTENAQIVLDTLPFGQTMKQFADNLAEEYEKLETEQNAQAVLSETTKAKLTETIKEETAQASAPSNAAPKKKIEQKPKKGYAPVYYNEVKYRGNTVTTALKNNSSYSGKYKLTFYCPCKKCCGKTNGITASGTKAKEGRTAAILNSNLPMGSKIHIEGYGDFIVEDRGGKKTNTIDIFLNSHSKALQYGVKYANVYLIK